KHLGLALLFFNLLFPLVMVVNLYFGLMCIIVYHFWRINTPWYFQNIIFTITFPVHGDKQDKYRFVIRIAFYLNAAFMQFYQAFGKRQTNARARIDNRRG